LPFVQEAMDTLVYLQKTHLKSYTNLEIGLTTAILLLFSRYFLCIVY